MTVALYSSGWKSLGGGEKYPCCVAEALASRPNLRVLLVVDAPQATRETLERLFHVDLGGVEVVFAPGTVRTWLSAAHLAFICSNVRSLGLPAPRTVYMIQIPYGPRGWTRVATTLLARGPRAAAKVVHQRRLLETARKAAHVVTNSLFVQDTVLRHHGIRSTLIYPPVDDFGLTPVPKERLILSVGRFFQGPYNQKRHEVLIDAFKALWRRLEGEGWEYHLVGTCEAGEGSAYLDALRARAQGYPVCFHVNAPYEELASLYARAALFWHAAGVGVDEAREPERVEHFGMSTAEAMTARCIPFVPPRGGQREIVEDGVSGFFWSTPDQLVSKTLELIRAPSLWPPLQEASRARALRFSRHRFQREVVELFESLLGSPLPPRQGGPGLHQLGAGGILWC